MKIRFRQIPFLYREADFDRDGVGVGVCDEPTLCDGVGVGVGAADELEGLGVGDAPDTAAWAGTMMVPTTGFVHADGSTVSPTAAAATA